MSSRMSLVEVPSLGPGSCSLASSTVAQWQRRSRAASRPSPEMDTSRRSATNGGGCERRPGEEWWYSESALMGKRPEACSC
jgi:hypothetical protein